MTYDEMMTRWSELQRKQCERESSLTDDERRELEGLQAAMDDFLADMHGR